MDWDSIKSSVLIANTIGSILIAAVLWLRKPGQEAAKDVAALRAELQTQHREITVELQSRHEDMSARLTVLEERVEHMPKARELSQLHGSLQSLAAHMRANAEATTAMRASVSRLEDHLLSSNR
jgi:hypothetical protein